MNVFQVTLRNIKRPEVSKIIDVEAHNRDQAAMLSERAGFRVALVKAMPMGDRKLKTNKSISKKDLIKLFRALASMLKANISTADALTYYAQGLPDPGLQGSVMSIKNRLEAGMSVHVAFAKERKFDPTMITMIEAGSDAGQLHQAFTAMARTIKVQMGFASKMRNALLVPCMVILFQIGLFIWSQVSVVGKVEETLQSVRQEPDEMSKVIFAFSHIVRAVWPFFIIALGAFIVALFRSANLRQNLLNFFMSKWRLLAKLVMGLRQTAYLGTLQMLYSNGINLARASMLSAKVVQGTPTYAPLVEASQIYEGSGLPFAEALKKRPVLDPQVMHMISIGERSASLPEQLEMLRDIYEEDTAQTMADFTQIINLITLACAMFLIGLVFAGAMLPIFLMGPRMMKSGMS
ncbi:MAG TPA: type II secretion system F family protein [Candidatus Saccharimonadia bacterium]|nr:type II secretion system F family protein [Candidatus Saccharimonadia bacterium]